MLIFLRILELTILYGGGAYLCYAPFRYELRFSLRKTVGFLLLLFGLILAGYVGLLLLLSDKAAHMYFLAMLPVMGAFYLWSIKESADKAVLVFLLVGCYGAFICGCASFFANLLFSGIINMDIFYVVAILLIGGATFYLMYHFTSERLVPLINLVSSNDLQSVYFMPLFYIILQATFFTLYDTLGQMSNLVYFVVLVALNVSTYFLLMDILHILGNAVDKMRLQEEISVAEKMLELQKNQYASWVKQIEAVRRARHDLKHHIAMVQLFIDNDDKAGLQAHVREFQRTMPESSPMLLCKNIDVNAILLHYYERARKENIKLELLANVEQDIEINSQDLAVVFGNCLENAFEACQRLEPTAEKVVSLMAKPMGKGLAIIIDNTFDGQAEQENDLYLSNKREHQLGIGMTSVKLVVEKYSGIVTFETKGNIFMTSIRLGSKKQAK